jgi:hypothetical protein
MRVCGCIGSFIVDMLEPFSALCLKIICSEFPCALADGRPRRQRAEEDRQAQRRAKHIQAADGQDARGSLEGAVCVFSNVLDDCSLDTTIEHGQAARHEGAQAEEDVCLVFYCLVPLLSLTRVFAGTRRSTQTFRTSRSTWSRPTTPSRPSKTLK